MPGLNLRPGPWGRRRRLASVTLHRIDEEQARLLHPLFDKVEQRTAKRFKQVTRVIGGTVWNARGCQRLMTPNGLAQLTTERSISPLWMA
ncbi:hypothetical protein ACIQVE_25175 [Pseudomonas sp. NPDC098747]|uniref:hypothetical protein n=1 Tax=Pseudomonas sp. NPDC098747 TaxID=3364487 RepID=UPI003839E974